MESSAKLILAVVVLAAPGWTHRCPRECSCPVPIEAKCSSDTLEELPRGFDPQLMVLVGNFPKLTALRNNSFAYMDTPELATVYLRYSGIRTVESGTFLAFPKLFDVDLTANSITSLSSASFPESVRRLNVDYNSLRLPTDTTFLDAAHLESLHLGRCGIATLPDRVFQGTPRITYLILSDNLLENTNPNAFRVLVNLEILNLNNNRLTTLHPDTFQHNRNLSVLSVSGNRLTLTETTSFLNAPFIKHLFIGDNRLTTLPANTFHNMTSLETISLEDNLLESIDGAFEHLPMLRMLFLFNNNIRRVDADTFQHNNALYELSLSNNSLTLPERGSLLNAPNLATLGLARCGITNMPQQLFHSMGGLKNIFLNDNGMTKVDVRAFEGLNQLAWISLSENPAVCPCIPQDLAEWSTTRNVKIAASCGGRDSRICR